MTNTFTRRGRRWLHASCGALALGLVLAGAAQAQLSTATLNGRITEDSAESPVLRWWPLSSAPALSSAP